MSSSSNSIVMSEVSGKIHLTLKGDVEFLKNFCRQYLRDNQSDDEEILIKPITVRRPTTSAGRSVSYSDEGRVSPPERFVDLSDTAESVSLRRDTSHRTGTARFRQSFGK